MENVHDVAAAIIDELGPMDAMKLQKLLYYTQAWSAAITDEPMFDAEVQAWRDGPVVPSIFKHHKQLRKVRAWDHGSSTRLAPESMELVRMVCGQYGHQSGDELSDLTHCETPWNDARVGYAPEDSSQEKIPVSDMARYYRRSRTLGGRRASDLSAGGLSPVHSEAVCVSDFEHFSDYSGAGLSPVSIMVDTESRSPVMGFGQRINVESVRPAGFRPSRLRFGG